MSPEKVRRTPAKAQQIVAHLSALGDPDIAEHSKRFFKTATGEYGAGDRFLGIRVPVIRQAVKHFKTAELDTATRLLLSDYHEIRLFALLLMVQRFTRHPQEHEALYRAYLHHTDRINNWDLVDCSAAQIVGGWLEHRNRAILPSLARSDSLWERRISIMATFHFIRGQQYRDTLKLASILRNDPHDLIHKAVGWMLREIGNRDPQTEMNFLDVHYQQMPRTMLRYAIEKFDEPLRQAYLKGTR